MGVKLFYKLLVILLVFGGIEKKLYGEDISESPTNYRILSNANTDTPDSGVFPKKKSYLDKFNEWPRKKKTIALNAASVITTMTVGAASWDYYSSSFDTRNEGWFDPDTKYGGADKLGHAYGGYALTSTYNSIYKKFGYSDKQAILRGAISSWSLMTLIELGDGFSEDYGFSWQDETMNSIGIGLAYLRNRFPSLKEKFDYRVEWYPSEPFRDGVAKDPFTDYSGQKYLIALKPDGFLKTDNSLVKALEVHVGYYTRGFSEKPKYYTSENRYMYVGLGLNMTYIIEQLTGRKLGGIFNYVQIPFTYVATSAKID